MSTLTLFLFLIPRKPQLDHCEGTDFIFLHQWQNTFHSE